MVFLKNIEPTKTHDYLIKYGYAGGKYNCTCHACGDVFVGDKRAVTCEECARDMLSEDDIA